MNKDKNQNKSQFAKLISHHCLGIIKKVLESKTGIERQTFWYWENDKVIPKFEKVKQFAKGLCLNDTQTEQLLKAAAERHNSRITTTNVQEQQNELTESAQKQEDDLINNVNPETVDNALARQDLSEMPNIPVFYGRDDELATLTQWIVKEKCRLMAILGIGGIGKTALAAKLVKHIQHEFQYVIWKSLREAPSVENILGDVIKVLSNFHDIDGPDSLGHKITQLIEYLDQSRCLLVLDNVETILQQGTHVGQYRKGDEGYGELIKRVGESSHQSCLVLTSREKPKEIKLLAGETGPIRSRQITGLDESEGDKFFTNIPYFSHSPLDLIKLIRHYACNPFALKVVAGDIQEWSFEDISKWIGQLDDGGSIFDDINHLLTEQFERLSVTEREVIYWLAINREPILMSDLKEDVVSPKIKREVCNAVNSLRRRYLIEKVADDGFTLQNVMMEYTTEQLVTKVVTEIETAEISFFNSHALIKATAKDYVRETQIRLILDAVKDRLIADMGQTRVEKRLKQILSKLRKESPGLPGYAAGNIFNLLRQMDIDLSGSDFYQLAVWQAYFQGLDLHRVNFAHAEFKQSVFTQTIGSVLAVALSPDGKWLATGDANNEVRLWRMPSCELYSVFKEHTDWVFSVAFSPDGQMLASGSQDGTINIRHLREEKCLKTLTIEHDTWVRSIAFNRDGLLASVGGDDDVKIWNSDDGTLFKKLSGHTDRVQAVAFSPVDGQILVSGGEDHSVRIWDIRQAEEPLQTLEGHNGWTRAIAISPDGKKIASGSYDHTIKLWDMHTGQCLDTLKRPEGHTDRVRAVAFSPDGQTLASGSYDSTIRLWNVHTAKCQQVLQGHTDWVWSIAFSADGKILASGSNDQTVRLWDVQTGRCLKTVHGYVNWIWSVAFSPDGQTLASGSNDHAVRIWDRQTGQCLKTLHEHKGWVRSVAFSSDGQKLVTGSEDKTVRVYSAPDLRGFGNLEGLDKATILGKHDNWVESVSFSPDDEQIASCGGDSTVKIWRVTDGECIKNFSYSDRVRSVVFSPDGQFLVTGIDNRIDDNTVRIRNIESDEQSKTLGEHSNGVLSVSFNSDGQKLASGGQDNTVKIWDVANNKSIHTLQGHTGKVRSVVFSTNCRIVVSGSDDKTIKIWDTYNGECVKTLSGHERPVLSVAISPDAQTIASSSKDETIRLWDINTGDCLMTLRLPKPYDGMNITKAAGLTDEQKAALKALGAVEYNGFTDLTD